ncbi:MAG: VWA domain-containing protein [Flavobacteriaceae bacterium]|nr:VWA domain-containing protein [Flavobacteriaceae bacterium]
MLFTLRSIGVFLLLLLLINPTIEKRKISTKKPTLAVVVDNSLSIQHFKKENTVTHLINQLTKNIALQDKFKLQLFQFDKTVKNLDTLNFKGVHTNIYEAITTINNLDKNQRHPIVLISDGNQTNGMAYPFVETTKNVFPVIIGDTIVKNDVSITQLNVNKYSYLKNKFPVEINVLFDGNTDANTQIRIQHKGNTVFKKNLSFSEGLQTQTITTTIASEKEGLQYYTASLTPIPDEENTENNTKTFSVDVLNKQTNVLVLASFLHPDVGMLKKAIETNKQRTVDIYQISDFKKNIDAYQLIILYQPTASFLPIFEKINNEQHNYFVVTGTKTQWNFLNEVQPNYYKNSINQTEEYGAVFNSGFLTFGQSDIGFNDFPPLKDVFGKIRINTKFDALLHQNIAGLKTTTPLLATFENGKQKSAVLFGESIWKWRTTSFVNTGSFQDFDAFLSNLIQYLATTKKRERLSLTYESLFSANSSITISAFYVDKNYVFDPRAKLHLKLINTTSNTQQNIPFSLQNNSFDVVLDDLTSGDYQFTVTVENQDIKKTGTFKITTYQIEEQFSKANTKELSLLAANTKGEVYTEATIHSLTDKLLANTTYKTIQSSKLIKQQLIDWKLLLTFVILCFSVEWLIRKYYGKI